MVISIIPLKGLSFCFSVRNPICIFQGSDSFYGWESSVINTVTTNEKVTTVCKADEKFSKEAAYNIVIGVKDNGLYDHNASEDIVTDPVVLYTDGTFAEDPKSGGSNGGGCSAAGWSVLALAPLGIFALYGRRKK